MVTITGDETPNDLIEAIQHHAFARVTLRAGAAWTALHIDPLLDAWETARAS